MARSVIIGYDGSEHSAESLGLGRLLCRALAAEPVIATVLPRIDPLIPIDTLRYGTRSHAERILENARAALGAAEAGQRVLFDDSAARALYALAEEEEPLALVVGATRHGPLGRVLLGDVASGLLAGGPCAVAVAPRGYAAEERRLGSIAVAVNGSPEATEAAASVGRLAARLRVPVLLLAAVDPVRFGQVAPFPVFDAPRIEEIAEQAMARALELAGERIPAEVVVERRLLHGPPAEALAEAAEDADLLVVGSRSYGPVRRALLGGTAAKLLGEARRPVLVLPRGAGPDALRIAEIEAREAGG